MILTQENGAQAAEGELKPGVQNPGRKEEDDAGVLLPHCCRLNIVEEDFKYRLCFSYYNFILENIIHNLWEGKIRMVQVFFEKGHTHTAACHYPTTISNIAR
jgi:hypothetical protein